MSDNKLLENLKKLRDELRIKLHLGEMDVKEWWAGVEPQFQKLEETLVEEAGKAEDSAAIITEELGKAYKRMLERLNGSDSE